MKFRSSIFFVLFIVLLCSCSRSSDDDAREQQVLDYYYRAEASCESEDFGPALKEALYAYDLAMTLDDSELLARIEFLIARIYSAGYDFVEAYKWDMLSLNHRKQSSFADERLIDSYECVSEVLLNMMWVKSAIQYADTAISLSSKPRPHSEEIKCLSYLVLHEKDKADSIINIMSSLDYESPYVASMMRSFKEFTPDEKIEYLDSVIKEKDEFITNQRINNLSEYRQEFEREKAEMLANSLKAKQKENVIITLLAIFIVISISLLTVSLMLRAKTLRLRKENQIQTLTIEYENLLAEHTSYQDKIKQEVSMAFLKQFSWLDKLGQMYLKANKTPRDRERILFENVDKEIELLASKNNFLKQVQQLMAEHNGDLLMQIDGLNLIRSEREIVIYSICGLSPAVMAVLANKSPRAVYNLKARIKEKLTRIDSQFARQILETL